MFLADGEKQKLDGGNRYTVRFAPGQLPPVHAFWSLTMYEMPMSLLTANPIDRFGLTLHIQHESPGKEKEANWLPGPKGPFVMALRLYWPKEEATEGKWITPLAQKVAN